MGKWHYRIADPRFRGHAAGSIDEVGVSFCSRERGWGPWKKWEYGYVVMAPEVDWMHGSADFYWRVVGFFPELVEAENTRNFMLIQRQRNKP